MAAKGMTGRIGRWAGVSGAMVVAGLLATAGAASAHVTVQPNTAAAGGYAKVAFRVPNEEDQAATTSVEVTLPADHPIASVLTRATPGWTVKVDKAALATPIDTDDGQVRQAVSKITWTGGAIAPGGFEDFEVSLGPLPTGVDTLVFKAVQTYDNGDVVRWINQSTPGGDEPDHPAPTLKVTTQAPAERPVAATTSTADPSGFGTVLGIGAGVLALAALALATVAVRRAGRNGGGASS
ncbi:YcnI family protein [Kutzneria sp. NPDC051319]|uniref:YcnI family protein n=1 Tax=Kutzneria sp. NPDC051319 TaxID=3155047 RepID=UPI00341C5A2D